MKRESYDIDKNTPVISVKALFKSFGENEVLKGVDLELYKGENVVILGRSGSGKSVLIKIIAGLLKADSGTVSILGSEVNNLEIKELRALRLNIGFSFQSSALYDGMTVWENLQFPLVRNRRELTRQQVNEAIEQVLNDVGLLQTIDQMPAELSGGQKKRIGIARMLILKPEIMLYDEPTGGLDPVTCMEINNLINKVQQQYNTSSIIITHDLSCAKTTGNRIVMLSDGKFFRQGSFEDVFNTEDERVMSFYNYYMINQ
jgi:phospholipid/cholesterol/gamma-HCH transport system ATP-binding protein